MRLLKKVRTAIRRAWPNAREHRWLWPALVVAGAVAAVLGLLAARQTLLATLAGLAAVTGSAYTARTFNLSRRGQLADRYTKAITQLASDKLAERIGGVYGLEHLMRESARDHQTVVDVLAAFVREQAPAVPAVAEDPGPSSTEVASSLQPSPPSRPATDVPAALTVLTRRPSRRELHPVDLERTALVGADLPDVRLPGANLRGAQLQGANLGRAHLENADLREADLQNADMFGAQLQSANMFAAQLHRTDLRMAQLQWANLRNAQLYNAQLYGAQLRCAFLDDAQLQLADLRKADLQGADIEPHQLVDAFVGADTALDPEVRSALACWTATPGDAGGDQSEPPASS